MTVHVRRLLTSVLAAALLAPTLACNKTTTIPTPVLVTEDKTGTVNPNSSDFKTFTVNYTYSNTDAIVTIKSLTSVATGQPVTTTLGVGFGQIAFDGTCTRATQFTVVAGTVGTPYNTSPYAPFGAAQYCISVFDTGTIPEALNYTLTLQHY